MDLAKKAELTPESPIYIGDRPASEMELSILTYNAASAQIKKISSIEELLQYKDAAKLSWINISGLKDVASINLLGELFSIHPLTIEDILHTEQQPKTEVFEKYKFLSIKTIQQEKKFPPLEWKKKKLIPFLGKKEISRAETDELVIDQICLIIMKDTLITFQEIPGDPFDGIRKRILDGTGKIRKAGTEYLAYTLIDAVVDKYALALNHLEDDIENLEARATKTSDDMFIEEIQETKNYVLQIRRAVSPLKDNITTIIRQGNFFQTDELKPFLQDLSENLSNAITTAENHREWLTNIMDVNLSVLTYQMNKVMKVLATISTIFIPLTFIAGVYGMNFHYMPELELEFGYPMILGGMAAIAFTMIIIFKLRHWF
ncbi:MAG: magnesium/cobalt transporter CorA [Treponema sp.]|nr:magnesium/cobalt transporter CorA [Treponema sp.]